MTSDVPATQAVITALAEGLVPDRRRPPWSGLTSAAASLGLTVTAGRALGAGAFEVELDLEDGDPSWRPDAAAGSDASPRALARRLRGELAPLLATRHPGAVIDLAVQLARPSPRRPRLLVMDMDSTVITLEVIDELARHHGVGPEIAAVTARAMAGELDFEASLRARVGRLAGLPAAILDDVAAALPLTDGVARLVATIRALGGWTAIASGGFTFAAEPVAARLGLDHAHANRLVLVDGRVTGELLGDVVTPTRKAELVAELAAAHGVDLAHTIAIGDGANDLLMLERAGLGVAFHAKPRLAAAADTAITAGGLDRVLYLLGLSDDEQAELLPR